jgi:dTDP-4-amino-4,6-dideoxygalactose transaminase
MYARHGALKKHHHQIEGINSRLDGLQASILLAKLPFIHEWTRQRIENGRLYNKYLRDISAINIPLVRINTTHTYHLYVVRAEKRDELAAHLKDLGIETAIHYPTALPNLSAYAYLGHNRLDFPVASRLQNEILSLPMYPELTEEKIAFIADKIRLFYK